MNAMAGKLNLNFSVIGWCRQEKQNKASPQKKIDAHVSQKVHKKSGIGLDFYACTDSSKL